MLPLQAGITLEQAGNQRWLVVSAPPDQVWPKVREFWTRNGFALKRDDPTIGIMETDWLENRADIPQDGIRAVLKKYLDVLYSAPTRDRFRVRLERAAGGNATDVYLTHSGVEEVAVGGASASASNTYIWQRRPSDPELEAEMLNRLMVFLLSLIHIYHGQMDVVLLEAEQGGGIVDEDVGVEHEEPGGGRTGLGLVGGDIGHGCEMGRRGTEEER